MAKSELHRDYILELENELLEFEKKADSTTKRMQMLVYPAMVAFFILAAFGFYLIYSLTSDVKRMADTFVTMNGSIDGSMDSISDTMGHMSKQMDNLVDSTSSMSTSVGSMSENTVEMVNSIGGLRSATYDMAASTNNMQRDMWSLNKNISTPLSFMNNFLPWKNDQSLPFQGSRAPLPPSYYAYPARRPAAYGSANIPGQVPMPMNIPMPQSVPPVPNGYAVPNQVQPDSAAPADVTVKSNDQSSLPQSQFTPAVTSVSLN